MLLCWEVVVQHVFKWQLICQNVTVVLHMIGRTLTNTAWKINTATRAHAMGTKFDAEELKNLKLKSPLTQRKNLKSPLMTSRKSLKSPLTTSALTRNFQMD